jgi:hypothetical protein
MKRLLDAMPNKIGERVRILEAAAQFQSSEYQSIMQSFSESCRGHPN